MFFMSPLFSLKQVFKSKDATVINKPATISTFVSAILWALFGLHIGDNYIYFSNLFGLSSAFILLLCILRYGQNVALLNDNVFELLSEKKDSGPIPYQIKIPKLEI
ncbi:Sugar transporter SWEET1 [Smittium culicis]|uniref:Sugar transporter SWEET1 n=1 Tax=Smittium culicis TaxID=133412 RepID=A0A1R1XSL0_9FUNG|nr:Sugar transporter SWEET1 [Smittium culicis]OMJ25706.1 Sugar transporter SWEET1 [Smittium culicis]